MVKLLISLGELKRLNDKEFDLIRSLYSKKQGYLSTEEIEVKYYLNKEDEYDNTPVGMEACWAEYSGALVYFVSKENMLCHINEHEIGIDFFEEYNICVYQGFIWNYLVPNKNFALINFQFSESIQNDMTDDALKNFELIHQRESGLKVDWDYWIYEYEYDRDIFKIFRDDAKKAKINFQIFRSNKRHNRYLLKAEDFFCFYNLPKNLNCDTQQLFDLMVSQNLKLASNPITKKISQTAINKYREWHKMMLMEIKYPITD